MGKIYIFTGDGAGKTTNALGLAMRSIGHGHQVVMIQFMKWWKETGEYKIQEKLGDYYKVYQFGRETWLKISSKEAKFGKQKFKTEEPSEEDRKDALLGLQKAEEVLTKEKPSLLILDEILLAIHSKLLKDEEVLDLLTKIPSKTTVVLTGRNASKKLMDRADFVNSLKADKYPRDIPSERGIQY